MFNIPVVFVIYNRLETAIRVFNIISEITSFKKVKTTAAKKTIGHYKNTPYSYLPNIGLKYNLKENYDIGAGLIELIETIDKEINDKK